LIIIESPYFRDVLSPADSQVPPVGRVSLVEKLLSHRFTVRDYGEI